MAGWRIGHAGIFTNPSYLNMPTKPVSNPLITNQNSYLRDFRIYGDMFVEVHNACRERNNVYAISYGAGSPGELDNLDIYWTWLQRFQIEGLTNSCIISYKNPTTGNYYADKAEVCQLAFGRDDFTNVSEATRNTLHLALYLEEIRRVIELLHIWLGRGLSQAMHRYITYDQNPGPPYFNSKGDSVDDWEGHTFDPSTYAISGDPGGAHVEGVYGIPSTTSPQHYYHNGSQHRGWLILTADVPNNDAARRAWINLRYSNYYQKWEPGTGTVDAEGSTYEAEIIVGRGGLTTPYYGWTILTTDQVNTVSIPGRKGTDGWGFFSTEIYGFTPGCSFDPPYQQVVFLKMADSDEHSLKDIEEQDWVSMVGATHKRQLQRANDPPSYPAQLTFPDFAEDGFIYG